MAAQSPPAASLQPGGVLTRMGQHILPPTEVYFDDVDRDFTSTDGQNGIAVSGDLLFVTGLDNNALSVWRVNTEAGTLSRTAVYRDDAVGDGGFDGLSRASGVALSASGDLLFVTARNDNALSVWQVNAAEASLSQLVVYQNGQDQNGTVIEGLAGAAGAVVSGDLLFVVSGDLPFVAGFSDNALSVWRVNESSGTLRQTAVYKSGTIDNAGNSVDGLGGAVSVDASGDLLFVMGNTSDTISVWRVNESLGTLEQTAVYRSRSPKDVAVSGDLLFVSGFGAEPLSVWRVNAEAGTLSRTAVYEDRGGGVNGLEGATGIAVSGDGDLLFVTSIDESALGVWRVNAEAGTLSQTALYEDLDTTFRINEDDGMARSRSPLGPRNAAVSGDLLFVSAVFAGGGNVGNVGNISAWHINDAEVSAVKQTVIRVQSDMPVAEEVVVTVTAQSGANMVEATATLSPSTPSADAIFPPGTLRPSGRWTFTAQASPPTALDTSAARIAMQVLPPLLSLEPQQDQFAQGSTIALTVRTIAGLLEPASFEIDAVNETTTTITVEYSAGATEQEVLFPAEDIAMSGLGQLDFFIRLPDNSPFRVGDGPAATVQIVIPQLQLVPQQNQFFLGSSVILTVQADPAALTEATYNIIVTRPVLATTSQVEVTHPAGVTAQEVSFSPQQIDNAGLWEFSIQLPDGSPFQVMADGTTEVEVLPAPAVSLQPGGVLTMREHAVPTDEHLDARLGIDGLGGAQGVAASSDLLFITGLNDDALSVWRVNAEAGTLRQTVVYQNSDSEIDGLAGALEVVVSASGNLLFVTADSSNALSVWRVNAEAATLSQLVVYQDGQNQNGTMIEGLTGAGGAVLSGDLLFVAGFFGALSVWQVNESSGTLRQTAFYRNGDDDNTGFPVDGLNGAMDVAVSGDLLFVTGFNGGSLSVWRVNESSGTLEHTTVYRDGDPGIDGLAGAQTVAVSGSLLFVTGLNDGALSVWRVNAEAGELSQIVVYRNGDPDGDSEIRGLGGAQDVAVSGDLLFVTGNTSDTLSIWRVNAEAGELSQIVVYQDGTGGIDGLNGANNIAISGDLLFVTASDDNALSAWHINNAEVPLEEPTVVRVESDMPVAEEVVVTVTAQSGADMVEATATLSPSTPSADAIFPPGTLRPSGRWTFTAQASPPTALDTSAARIAMQVLPPLLSLEPQQDQFAQGSTIALTVRTIAGLLEPASFEIDAVNETTTTITVEYSAGATEQEVLFPAEDIAMSGLGQLDFFIRLPDNSPFRVGDGPAATVQIVIPQLQLVPQQNQFFLGSSVILTVQADPAALTEATYNIIVTRPVLATTSQVEVTHPEGVTAQEVSFSPEQIDSAGQWEFSIQLPDGSPFQVMADGTTIVEVRQVQLTLQLEAPTEVAARDDFAVRVSSVPAVPEGTTVTVIVSFGETDSSPVMLSAVTTSAAVMFTAPPRVDETLTLTASGSGESNIVLVVVTGAAAEVALVPQPVQLTLTAMPARVAAGEEVMVKVGVEPVLLADTTLTVTVTFGDAEAPDPVTLTDTLSSQSVTFTAPAVEAMEQLVVRAEVMAVMPEGLVAATTVEQTVEVLPAGTVALTLAAPENVIVGNTFTVTVGVEEGTPLADNTTVTATISLQNESGEDVAEPVVVELTPTMSLNTRILTAPLRAGDFTVTVSGEGEGAAIDQVLPISAQVSAEAVALVLQLSGPDTVIPGSTYQVTVQIDEALPEGTVLAVTVSDGTLAEPVMVELSPMMSSGTASLRAPLMMGEVVVTATVEDQTTGDAREEAVAVQLRLSGPAAAVTVGETYDVTVDTVERVPEGTMVTVAVSAGTGEPEMVMLTRDNPSEDVSFMAPLTAEEVMVTTIATPQTDEGALEVAVSDAEPLTVNVVAQDVQLVLSELPTGLVVAGSTFLVTVGAEPEVPVGTEVVITASLAGVASEPMTLTASATTAQVVVTAPADGGPALLLAEGAQTADSLLDLDVMPAERTLQVTRLVTLGLTLSPSSTAVETDSTFLVTVGTDDAVPMGAEVSVAVIFDGSTQTTTLSASTPAVELEFTAPNTAGTFTVEATGTASVEDVNALQLTVTPTSASVDVLRLVDLSLSAVPAADVLPGARVTLAATLDEVLSSPVSLTLLATLGGTTPDTIVIDIAAGELSASASFLPDSSGDWVFMAEGDSRLIDFAGARVQLTVLPTRLNFSTPPRSLNIDDVPLALRYIALCRNVAERDCNDQTTREGLDLARNLGGDYDLDALNRELVVPDLTGDGAGDMADLLIFYRFFNNIPLNRLLTEIPDEDRSILEAIILRAVAPLE